MLKRLFDVIGGIIVLVITFPLLFLTSLLVLIFDGSPVFYKAQRAGRGNSVFHLYKFRTMIRDADKVGPSITYGGDARITRLGQILRNTKLDELLQIINVLQGEMSLVGPRPESVEIVKSYTPEHMQTLKVKPGLTGPGALYYFKYQQDEKASDTESEEHYIKYQLPDKLKLDNEYIKRFHKFNILEDIRIVFITMFTILLFLLKKLGLKKK
jgi:lipopolysaccharide/colanic/teichoic acid biosynthesis glycosyltransferase